MKKSAKCSGKLCEIYSREVLGMALLSNVFAVESSFQVSTSDIKVKNALWIFFIGQRF